MSFGAPDLPADQRTVAPYHAFWSTEPLTRPVHVFGQTEVQVTCQTETDVSQIYVALCHLMTTRGGGHRLLTYGVQNIQGKQVRFQISPVLIVYFQVVQEFMILM